MSTDIQPPIRLPVWRIVKASLASVCQHPGNFIRRVWPWVAVVAVATAMLGFGFGMTFEENSVAAVVIALCLFVGPIMVVVSWHRGLLLGEPGGPETAFRLDRPFWRYLGIAIGTTLLVAACIGIPAAVIALLLTAFASSEAATASAIGLGTIGLLVTLPLTARLLLALPMAAVDAEPPLISGAWRLGRGNGWRLVGALIVLSFIGGLIQLVLVVPVSLVVGMAAGGEDLTGLHGAGVNLVLQPLGALAMLFNATLLASYASYAFAVLTNHPLGRDVTG